ncbi:ATP synthase F1 subunit gamma [Candidatus Nomurabacteria bacterium RIFCSPLOWO2_02_FULL_42_17]|uniref:ATP synthase gamma chain n=1 Tax=Candidatus Nomurabacteria bacterium RIFCSPLOWO2_02_FULL_42_17 TaxID=1801789 RepID=A0A1F6XTN5_9BACT|nr:MAG: ATP synthase gamma chain [Parcubacteria group bacterium GW2011_GWA2_42_18]OGI97368.1 MAG: ATP synthase F1 subunit gamma [Candidatus Nomurabacteria bacterium RIFCSPLOWO2_02_FULL_42_17]
MATTKEIKRRIKSVKNTKKITKAMELVAASKMRRAVNQTLSSRAYAGYAWNILQSISQAASEEIYPLFQAREVKKVLAVLITSNKGLCGAYNSQIIKKTIAMLKEESGTQPNFISIGRKGDTALKRLGVNIIASFADLPDNITQKEVIPIASIILDAYKRAEYDRVLILYTDYVTALSQIPRARQLLPIVAEDLTTEVRPQEEFRKSDFGRTLEYLFEPDYHELVPSIVEKLSKMQVYQMLLESIASEQSARMVAMQNASEAAGEMIDEFTLLFNKNRQAAITREISEISAGMTTIG